MRRFSLSARLMVAAAAASAIAIAVTAGGAVAGGSATLTLQLFPSSLLPGGAGAALVTFKNNGPSTLNHVVVTVTLPAGFTFDAAHSSAYCKAKAQVVTCPLVGGGSILLGASVFTTIAFTAPNAGTNLPFKSSATWNSQTNGKPNGSPGNQPFTIKSPDANASVISAGSLVGSASSCKSGGDSLDASDQENGQSIAVTAGANSVGLTCTPITTGIDNASIFFAKLPPLTTPATVVLTFADGNLPFATETDEDSPAPPMYLDEYPNYPSLAGEVSVPACEDYVQSPNGPESIPTDPALSNSSDACISRVDPADDSSADDGEPDFDQGTITLEVQGSTTGDGGFHGR
jgi:hypothetical protein